MFLSKSSLFIRSLFHAEVRSERDGLVHPPPPPWRMRTGSATASASEPEQHSGQKVVRHGTGRQQARAPGFLKPLQSLERFVGFKMPILNCSLAINYLIRVPNVDRGQHIFCNIFSVFILTFHITEQFLIIQRSPS